MQMSAECAIFLCAGSAFSLLLFKRFSGNIVTRQASKILDEDEPSGGPAIASEQPETITLDDDVLVERCRKGDMQAFGVLVEKYQSRIFNMIFRMCSRRADADELSQEVFLRALKSLDNFRGKSKFYTWLFRIAANLTISHRRRSGRVSFQSLDADERFDCQRADELTAEIAGKRSQNPADAAQATETGELITAALNELDDDFRLIVVLRDVEDMDYAEISSTLNVPIGTVKSRLHRARCILRNKLTALI